MEQTINLYRRLPLIFVFGLVLFIHCGEDSPDRVPDPEPELITIGNLVIEALVTGTGNHTVVFESTAGEQLDIWVDFNMVSEISGTNQVIAYNRAGYGQSPIINDPRTLQALTDELLELINQTAENEKVILVGHAFGGAIIRTFAVRFPEKVEALLMLDPWHEDLYEGWNQGDEDQLVATYNQVGKTGAAAEARQTLENIAYLNTLPTLPQVLTTVITARFDIDSYDARFAAHETLGDGIPPSTFRHEVINFGPNLHVESPSTVINEIYTFIARLN